MQASLGLAVKSFFVTASETVVIVGDSLVAVNEVSLASLFD
jgi:hypothetical protein